MKRWLCVTAVMMVALVFLAACANRQMRPEAERNTEVKMAVLQEKITDAKRSGTLTTDQADDYNKRLKRIRDDYQDMAGKNAASEDWNTLNTRLDRLQQDLSRSTAGRASAITPGAAVVTDERIAAIQRRIDVARANGTLSARDADDLQARLNAIRSASLRPSSGPYIAPGGMGAGGTAPGLYMKSDISRDIDSLEADLGRAR